MPSGAAVHAAVFAFGALVGGGVAAAAVSSRKRELQPAVPVPASKPIAPTPPIIQSNAHGQPMLVAPAASSVLLDSVLKYGNPGECEVGEVKG
jgi:endonuclease G, mitochondrial